MARKQLIKGANAARVEERIARVPDEPGVDSAAAQSIFGALRAMESDAAREGAKPPAHSPAAGTKPAAKPAAAEPAATRPAARSAVAKPAVAKPAIKASAAKPAAAKPAIKASAAKRAKPTKPATKAPAAKPKAASAPRAAPALREARRPPRPAQGRLRPSDFSEAERRAILRCCLDYRNRLPTYLLSARKEVEIIDSIIGKCGS